MAPFDVTRDDVAPLVDEAEARCAVLLLGDTKPDSCVADPERSEEVNVRGMVRLVDRLAGLGVKPIFTSSEFVFEGEKGDYLETDPAEPVLLYGAQKLAVERHLRERCPDHAILRLAKVYGQTPGDGTFFTGWAEALRQGTTAMRCAADQRFSPVLVDDVVEGVVRAARRDLQGTYHLGGPEGRSRIELLEMLLAACARRTSRRMEVEPCSIHDFDLPEKRPLDVSMRVDAIVDALDLELHGPAQMCEVIAERCFVQEAP
jgi:dTDP-4-dehydrorhamnose reductase